MPISNIRELDLSVDELKRIRDVKLFKSVHIMARDIFMLTYYLGGINLRDLMEYDFTKGNCMRYIRHKTRNSKKNENEIQFVTKTNENACSNICRVALSIHCSLRRTADGYEQIVRRMEKYQ